MKTIVVDDLKNTKDFGIRSRDLLLLIAHILQKTYKEVFFAKKLEFSPEQYELLLKMIEKRKNSCPIAKIVGYKEFYGLNFRTTEDTLDPRPETELIIDLILELYPERDRKYRIVDLGSGTGCIAITLLSLFQNSTAVLVDIDAKTLVVSKQNARKHNVFERCELVQSDWFEKVSRTYDIIVSNPPYVEEGFELDKQTSFDPGLALFAGEKGLDAYKKIIPSCANYLSENGMVFIEVGVGQGELVSKLLPPDINLVKIQKDLSGIDRIMVLRKNAQKNI